MDENKEIGFGTENQQDVTQPEQPVYGQPNEQSGQPIYGQPGQQTYGQTYGQNYGQPVYGQPLKNNYAMKLTFSILEILCCCGCNIVTMIMGIIACVHTTQANSAYKEGRWEDFKAKSKSASILLWIGLGVEVVVLVISILAWTIGGMGQEFVAGFEQGYDVATDYGDDDDYDYDYDYADDTDAYGTETGIAATEIEPESEVVSEPVVVTPGEGFTDPTITVNGATVTFPLTYPELMAAGFYIDAEDEEYVVNKNEYYYPTLYDANGVDLGYVYIGNETDGPLAMKDCTVFGFDINSYGLEDGDVTFSLPNGLNQNATKEDFITAYGEPDYEYESESYDHQSYQWYNHSDLYYDSEENSISVDFWDGVLDEIDMKYIGWD